MSFKMVLKYLVVFWLFPVNIVEAKDISSVVSLVGIIGKNDVCKGTTCPETCGCKPVGNGLVNVDCSWRNLHSIPNSFPRNTMHIFLYGNYLTKVKYHSFYGCNELTLIDLYDNIIDTIEEDAFVNIPNLAMLSLGRNQLSWFSNQSIPYGVFDPLSASLQTISLQHNLCWTNKTKPLKYKYRYDLTRKLTNLRNLRIDAQPGTHPSAQLCQNMHHLHTLGLYVWIRKISNNTFVNFSDCSIMELEMKDGFMYDLEPLAFAHFPKLEKIDLSFNYYLGFKNMSKSWYGLTFTKISKLNLTRINAFRGEDSFLIIGDRFFDRYMCQLNLTELILNFNDILAIKASISQCLPNLKYVGLKYNRLLVINSLIGDIGNLSNLSFFDCSYQSMQTRYSPDPNFNPDKAPYMSSRSLETVRNIPKKKTTWKVLCPPNLKTLILTESINVQFRVLPKIIIKGNCSIEYVDFGGNVMPHFKGPVQFQYPPEHPVAFDLHDNQITAISPYLLGKRGLRVSKLNLSFNKLGRYLSYRGNIFQQFKGLEELNLADNQIKSLPWLIFEDLSNLRILNLSENSLTEVSFKLGHMKNLTNIDLQSNMIPVLHEATMQVFGEISETHALQIGLSDNPLACSCQSLDFLYWLVQNNMTMFQLPKWNQLMCSYNAEFITMTNLTSTILPRLALQCQSRTWLIATSTLTVGVILIVGLSIFLFRHRWEIRFCCLKLARQRRNYSMLIEDGLFKYDAFVAYSGEDRDWVLGTLVPKLETYYRAKLYVYDNNALIGTKIEENIVEGITKSRKTILVLSRNFVSSQWCNYEVEMARVRSFDEGRDLIVPVLLEDIRAADVQLNSSLLTILRRYVFLEWPNHAEDHPQLVEEFWEKLKGAVLSGEQLLRCDCGRVTRQM